MSAAETAEVLACNMPVMSLTAEDGEEFDVSVDSHEAKVDENIALKQVLDALPPEERKLIDLRYFKEMTQAKTAEILGMSQVQVSRKEKKILEKLRGILV